MTKAAAKDSLGDKLEKAVELMLEQVKGKDIDVDLKLKVFDRALKYYAVKNRLGDSERGAGWEDPDPKGED